MATNREKLEKAKNDLTKLITQRSEKSGEIQSLADGARKEKAQEQLGKIDGKIVEELEEIEELELQVEREKLKADMESLQIREVKFLVGKLKKNDKKTIRNLESLVEKLLTLRVQKKALAGQESEITETLKAIARAYPNGWTESDDVYKRYLYVQIGDYLLTLQDNPEYSISVEDLEKLISPDEMRKYISVDKSAFLAAIEKGTVINIRTGQAVTFEDWEEMRTRSEREPKLDIKDKEKSADIRLIGVKPELFSLPIAELAQFEGIADKTVEAIANSKYHIRTIGDLYRLSGEALLSIRGIGSVRAKKIIDSIALFR